MAKLNTPKLEKKVQQAPMLQPEAPAPAPTTPEPVAEFNPVTISPVDAIPELADSGLTGNCVLIRINPKTILDVGEPDKLYEHARAAWSGKEIPSAAEYSHVVVMTKELVEVTRDGKKVKESKTSVLCVYDVEEFKAFGEADLAEFTHRDRASFCQRDKDGQLTDSLLEKRWMFKGTLNEQATRALKGLFWNKPVPMFWKIAKVSAEVFVTQNLSVQPPEKAAKSATGGTIRSFA